MSAGPILEAMLLGFRFGTPSGVGPQKMSDNSGLLPASLFLYGKAELKIMLEARNDEKEEECKDEPLKASVSRRSFYRESALSLVKSVRTLFFVTCCFLRPCSLPRSLRSASASI